MIKNSSNKPFPARQDGTSEPRRRLAPRLEGFRYANVRPTKGHDLINKGLIVAYKQGSRTMLDLDSVDAYHASLPRVEPKVAAK